MELANFWLPIIGGGLLWAIAIGAWFSDHRFVGVWFGFAGGVCLLLLLALQVQDSVTHSGPEIPSGVALDQRPWIELLEISAGPLTYDEQGARLGVTAQVKNTGKTPALNITMAAFVYLIGKDHFDILGEQKKFCDEVRRRKVVSGETLFKNRTETLRNSIPVSKVDLENFSFQGPDGRKFISPVLIGCVDYTSSIGTAHHQTGFAYMMSEGVGAAPVAQLTIPPGGSAAISPNLSASDHRVIEPARGDIPLGRVGLTRWLGGGFFAD